MIILDLSQVLLSNIAVQTRGDNALSEDMVRHMVLATIRMNNMKFKNTYGEFVIATDSRAGYWRKDFFPFYKANRKKTAESKINWPMVYACMDKIREELKERFPYRLIDVKGAEGDDVIGTLVQHYGDDPDGLATGKPILILSGDHDFGQLQQYPNVSQYDPVHKNYRQEANPQAYLLEQIIRGDKGDGVPNILSPDDTLVLGKRQTVMTQKRVDEILSKAPGFAGAPDLARNWARNETLIDLTKTPKNVADEIVDSFDSQHGKKSKDLMGYFMQHRLRQHMGNLNDFC